MRKVFRLLGIILEAIINIAEEKPATRYMSIYEAREKFEAGLISVREYNETFEHKKSI